MQKRFVVFCEGDTEYHYIDKMRKNQGVRISLKPINMHGGGYSNFLTQIKKESKNDCLAKFVIIDADRLKKHSEERQNFMNLVEYCKVQNEKEVVPHFLILNNPDFEYVACMHTPEYAGQDVERFLKKRFNVSSMEEFKKNVKVYDNLNDGECSYKIMIDKVRKMNNIVNNFYIIKKKTFEIVVKKTEVCLDNVTKRGTNMNEFFDVINWQEESI